MGWKDIFAKRRLSAERLVAARVTVADPAQAAQRAAAAAIESVESQVPESVLGIGGRTAVGALAAGYLRGFTAAKGGLDVQASHEVLHKAQAGFQPMTSALFETGALIGRHEAQCGTRRLLGLAASCLAGEASPEQVLTACDNAADRLQTHNPTQNFRFTAEERQAVLDGLTRAESHA